MFRPNSEQVAVGYIKNLTQSVTGSLIVGTSIPSELTAWKDGYIQVAVVGGSPNVDLPVASPVVQVDFWVPAINSQKPQWGRANTLAETVRINLYNEDSSMYTVTTPSGFNDARVFTSVARTEPRRVNADPAGHARYTMDIQFNWIEV